MEEDKEGEAVVVGAEAGGGGRGEGEDGGEEEEDSSGIPVDKGWAWIVVVGCFGMHVLVVGGVKSFGVLFVELQQLYDVSAKQLGVVHGLASVLMMALGPVSNALSVRYTCRAVVFVGGLLIGCGFVASALVPTFNWLYLTYSVLTGLGASLAYAPSVVMVGHHFTKRRALANGISVSGSAVGSFLLPNLMRYLLNQYGLRGALFIIGAIMLHVCLVAVLFRPFKAYRRRHPETEQHRPSGRKQRKRLIAGSGKGLAAESQEEEVGIGLGLGASRRQEEEEEEEGEVSEVVRRPAPSDGGGSLSTPLTPSLGGGAFHEDEDDNVFDDRTNDDDDDDGERSVAADVRGEEGCSFLSGAAGSVSKERNRSSSNSCYPKTSPSSTRSADPMEDEAATTADLEDMEEEEEEEGEGASVISMHDSCVVPRDEIPSALNPEPSLEDARRAVVQVVKDGGSSPKVELGSGGERSDATGGIFSRAASRQEGMYDYGVTDVVGASADESRRCEERDKSQRSHHGGLSQESGATSNPPKAKDEKDSVLRQVGRVTDRVGVELEKAPESDRADPIEEVNCASGYQETDDISSSRLNGTNATGDSVTTQTPTGGPEATERGEPDGPSGRLQDFQKLSPNLERVTRDASPSATPPTKDAPAPPSAKDAPPVTTQPITDLDQTGDAKKCSPGLIQHRPCTRSANNNNNRKFHTSSTTSSSTDTDSGVDVVTSSSIRSSLEKKLLRNSSQGSMTTHFGSFKQRCSTSEREGSFKLNFRKDSSKSKSAAAGGTATPSSGSTKRRAFKKGHAILERHPSALWDARLPESLKQAIEEEKRRTQQQQQQQQQQQASDSVELSNFSANSVVSLDSKDKGSPKLYRGSGSVKDSSKGQQHQRHGSAGRGTIGSFKAIDVANPIRLINERKKLLLASNVRYMSETGDVGAPALAAGQKAPLKRFYSVEATRHQQRSPTALNESFLHRRIRQISEMDSSWRSESSVFASAGDLALASLQNISESANEAEDDTFSTTSRGSRLKGIFRLSSETVRKGERTKRSVPLFDCSLMVNPVFLVFFLSLVCMNFGYPNIFVMLPSFCEEVGLDKTTAAFMVSIIGLTDLVGRIFIGWLSDLRLFPRKYGFMASLAGAGVLCTSLPSMKSYSGLVAFSCGFGFCGGCFIALIAVILVDFLGKERLASSFGLASVAMAVGIMAGPAIYGDMRDTAGSWDFAFVVSGFMSLAAAACIFMEPLAQYLINRQTKVTERQICDEML